MSNAFPGKHISDEAADMTVANKAHSDSYHAKENCAAAVAIYIPCIED